MRLCVLFRHPKSCCARDAGVSWQRIHISYFGVQKAAVAVQPVMRPLRFLKLFKQGLST